ncbi:MAG: hypothetical protein GY715_21465 [Planctomycetes bacterium]|nr:hypothetical protein [Planctomycetota bacterium]
MCRRTATCLVMLVAIGRAAGAPPEDDGSATGSVPIVFGLGGERPDWLWGDEGSVDPAWQPVIVAKLEAAFAKYPRKLLRDHLRAVHVVGRLNVRGVEYGGTLTGDRVYLVHRAGVRLVGIERGFHHEFSSVLRWCHRNRFPTHSWKAVNDQGFRYLGSGREALTQGRASGRWEARRHENGFLHEYAQASVEEDFNAIAAELFLGRPRFWRAVDASPRLHRKMVLAASFYNALDRSFCENAFRAFAPARPAWSEPAPRELSTGEALDRLDHASARARLGEVVAHLSRARRENDDAEVARLRSDFKRLMARSRETADTRPPDAPFAHAVVHPIFAPLEGQIIRLEGADVSSSDLSSILVLTIDLLERTDWTLASMRDAVHRRLLATGAVGLLVRLAQAPCAWPSHEVDLPPGRRHEIAELLVETERLLALVADALEMTPRLPAPEIPLALSWLRGEGPAYERRVAAWQAVEIALIRHAHHERLRGADGEERGKFPMAPSR